MWSIANEPGLDGDGERPQQAYDYFRPLYELAHASDPQNRPVTLVCCQNDYTTDIAERTMDVVCINRYYGWYNQRGLQRGDSSNPWRIYPAQTLIMAYWES